MASWMVRHKDGDKMTNLRVDAVKLKVQDGCLLFLDLEDERYPERSPLYVRQAYGPGFWSECWPIDEDGS